VLQAVKNRVHQHKLRLTCRALAFLAHAGDAELSTIAEAAGIWRFTAAYIINQALLYGYVESPSFASYKITEAGRNFVMKNSRLISDDV
jgi:hypothetical protein